MANSDRWLLIVCLLAAFAHGFAFFAFVRPDTSLSPDESEYLALGIGLAEKGELRLPSGEVAKRMPLYPVLIAVVYRWLPIDTWENAILCLQSLLAWCSAIFIALTSERLAGRRAGLIAGIIAALYAPYLYLQMQYLTETLLVFLVSSAVLLYVVAGVPADRSRWAALFGVSLLLALGVLTRENAMLLAAVFAVDAACRAGSAVHRALRAGIILAPSLVCVCAWGARNVERLDAFTLSTTGGLNFYLGHNEGYAHDPGLEHADYQIFQRLRAEVGLSEVEADRRLYREGLAYIAAHPGRTVVNGLKKIVVWLRPTVTLSAPTLLAFALLMIVVCGRGHRQRRYAADRRRLVHLAALVALAPAILYWLGLFWQTYRPWTSPLYVVPTGLIALLFLQGRPDVRGLLAGLVASQWLVAVVFIPIVRLRWVIDGMFIVAIGVALSRLCDWLAETPGGQKHAYNQTS